MYFLTVARLIRSSRAIPRMDIPLRFAFCIAFHRAFSRNVGFRGGMAALLAAAVRGQQPGHARFLRYNVCRVGRGLSPKSWPDGQDRNGGWQGVGMIRYRFA